MKKSSILIRKARPYDIDAIIALGMEGLELYQYPNMRVDKSKVYNVALECISAPCNFAWVVEDNGKVTGAICALVHPMLFYERSQASVVQFFCKTPGYGVKLMKKFLAWARSRPVIKMICFTLDARMDARVGRLLSRLGLKEELPVYIEFK